MNSEMPVERTRRGFTLVEMLVVMGIIGILIGLLFPAIGAIKKTANNARALAEAKDMVMALTAYRTDYGRYPLQVDAIQDRAYPSPQYEMLLQILRADASYSAIDTWNPRRTVYLEIPEGSMVNKRWKDPWGNDYSVAADFTGDRNIDTSVMNGYGTLSNVTAAVWSFGMDGISSANAAERKDDIVTW